MLRVVGSVAATVLISLAVIVGISSYHSTPSAVDSPTALAADAKTTALAALAQTTELTAAQTEMLAAITEMPVGCDASKGRKCRNSDAEFCWKNSYTRGIGKIPDECPRGKEMLGKFCYDKCEKGFERDGLDCRTECPSGMRDDGLYCRNAEYLREVSRNEANCMKTEQAKANVKAGMRGKICETWGPKLLSGWYAKCAKGFYLWGGTCCVCRPKKKMDCPRYDMDTLGGSANSCQKRTVFTGASPKCGTCGRGLQLEGLTSKSKDVECGLCYKKCKINYYGVGFVCWAEPPSGWTSCGMGAAKGGTKECKAAVYSQVRSVYDAFSSISGIKLPPGVVKAIEKGAKYASELGGKGMRAVKKIAKDALKELEDLIEEKLVDPRTKRVMKDVKQVYEAVKKAIPIVEDILRQRTVAGVFKQSLQLLTLFPEITKVMDQVKSVVGDVKARIAEGLNIVKKIKGRFTEIKGMNVPSDLMNEIGAAAKAEVDVAKNRERIKSEAKDMARKLEKMIEDMVDPNTKKIFQGFAKADGMIKQALPIVEKIKNAGLPADIIRYTAELAAIVDPTGIANVVKAYSYPVCSDIR